MINADQSLAVRAFSKADEVIRGGLLQYPKLRAATPQEPRAPAHGHRGRASAGLRRAELASDLQPCQNEDMARLTSKPQASTPSAVAEEIWHRAGHEIEFVLSGGIVRVIRAGKRVSTPTTAERLELFDRATARQQARQRANPTSGETAAGGRGWNRDAVYDRGRAP